VYYDDLHWPYGDKTFDQSLTYVEAWITYLTKQNVDMIIVPPVYELYIMQSSEFRIQKKNILPLFTSYLTEYCFTYSLVGKIGMIGDFADIEKAQSLLQSFEKTYTLTKNQMSIKKFHSPIVYRTKEIPLRKYYLRGLSYSNILVNKIIKFDLRYFKDAMVDTLIPLNYGYFHYQGTISKFLNFKKIRFHTLEKLDAIFQELVGIDKKKAEYSVTVVYTWHPDFLQREKRVLWLLQRGKKIDIHRKKI